MKKTEIIAKVLKTKVENIKGNMAVRLLTPYEAKEAMQLYSIEFGTWYSGMDKDKVIKAIERFEREVK